MKKLLITLLCMVSLSYADQSFMNLNDEPAAIVKASKPTDVYGLYAYALYLDTNCATEGTYNIYGNTYSLVPKLTISTGTSIGSNFLYNLIWNVLATNGVSIPPSQFSSIIFGEVSSASPVKSPSVKDGGFCSGKCGYANPVLNNVLLNYIDKSSGTQCINISCNDTTKACLIYQPVLKIN